jgi:hypothetical protein
MPLCKDIPSIQALACNLPFSRLPGLISLTFVYISPLFYLLLINKMQTKCKLNAKQQAEKERIVTGRMVALQIYDR